MDVLVYVHVGFFFQLFTSPSRQESHPVRVCHCTPAFLPLLFIPGSQTHSHVSQVHITHLSFVSQSEVPRERPTRVHPLWHTTHKVRHSTLTGTVALREGACQRDNHECHRLASCCCCLAESGGVASEIIKSPTGQHFQAGQTESSSGHKPSQQVRLVKFRAERLLIGR